jgi:flavin reductase (DIM6/NTAB) family NADH-FMN oxidoreductase RutF
VFVGAAVAWLECAPVRRMAVGEHRINVFGVRAVAHDPGTPPMVFQASRGCAPWPSETPATGGRRCDRGD